MRQDLIWDFFQNEAPETFRGSLPRLEYLVRRVSREGRVLNIGAGTGLFEELALEKGLDVYSLDPNERIVSAIRSRLGMKEKAVVGYVQDIPFESGFFQTVVVSEVLEHLGEEELEKALEEIHRVLERGGRILGTVPARENLREQLVVCPKCGERFHRWGHAQTFNAESVKVLLSRYFEVEEAFEHLFVDWSEVNWKGKIRSLAKKILFRMSLYGRYENIVFSGRKSHGEYSSC
jgi:SAM-dependent methyltransferase